MARPVNRLSVKTVNALKTLGYYPDGQGLYLQVGASGSKSWVYRYRLNGRARKRLAAV